MPLGASPAQTSAPLLPDGPLLRLTTAARSDPGLRRARNEDAFAADPERGLALVADGMGGHPSGNVASAVAAAELTAFLSRPGPLPSSLARTPGSRSPLGERMAEGVERVDARIRAEGASHPERAGMGTTLTALQLHPAEGRVVIGHVGDSRAYLYEGGRLRQITRDQTWVQQQIDAGSLSEEDARGHPWAHVLSQALGVGDPVACELLERDAAPGQIYLLCTDGLTTMLTHAAIERTLESALPGGVETAAAALVDAANDRGGLDNVTVVLVVIEAA